MISGYRGARVTSLNEISREIMSVVLRPCDANMAKIPLQLVCLRENRKREI